MHAAGRRSRELVHAGGRGGRGAARRPPAAPRPPRRRRAECSLRRALARTWSSSSTGTARRWGCRRWRSTRAPPTRAGQAHADDMATHGFLGHWGTDGSVPEQRFTAAGGTDMVLENASCFTDEQRAQARSRSAHRSEEHREGRGHVLPRDASARRPSQEHPEAVAQDGRHRRSRSRVATPTEIPVPCIAQEFVDPYGTYMPAPRSARAGAMLHVGGTIAAPATFAGVGLARVDAPQAAAGLGAQSPAVVPGSRAVPDVLARGVPDAHPGQGRAARSSRSTSPSATQASPGSTS